MIKRSALAIMALLVLMVMTSGCTDNKNTNTTNNQNISNQNQNKTTNNTNNTTGSSIKSPEEAKTIAMQYVNEPGVTAGTPVLNTVNGRQIYVVPLYKNGQAVGEIELDAKTGENLGGAGGAP
ncbi:MAG: PepSY domain-containing protein [Methanobacteriaceae archaeon]|nr:PepSY domain-containing protein [Methanobacteriaceae archaeon]